MSEPKFNLAQGLNLEKPQTSLTKTQKDISQIEAQAQQIHGEKPKVDES